MLELPIDTMMFLDTNDYKDELTEIEKAEELARRDLAKAEEERQKVINIIRKK